MFFGKGWGDLPSVDTLENFMLEAVTKFDEQPPLELKFDAADADAADAANSAGGDKDQGRTSGAYVLKYARCASPAAHFLPPESHNLEVEIVLPTATKLKGVVVILPGTGDAFYMLRRMLYGIPLASHGFATILPMCPYYGPRKPQGQFLHYLEHMSDMAKLGAGLMLEGERATEPL
jgi:hypothetical protein